MAVETRYVVIRADKSNKEKEVMTFTDKRAADEYDKMLDMADNLFDLLQDSDVNLDEKQADALSIFLAKQRDDVLIALQAKKKPATKKPSASKSANKEQAEADKSCEETKASTKKAVEDSLVDFVIEKDDAA